MLSRSLLMFSHLLKFQSLSSRLLHIRFCARYWKKSLKNLSIKMFAPPSPPFFFVKKGTFFVEIKSGNKTDLFHSHKSLLPLSICSQFINMSSASSNTKCWFYWKFVSVKYFQIHNFLTYLNISFDILSQDLPLGWE